MLNGGSLTSGFVLSKIKVFGIVMNDFSFDLKLHILESMM